MLTLLWCIGALGSTQRSFIHVAFAGRPPTELDGNTAHAYLLQCFITFITDSQFLLDDLKLL